MSSYYQIQCFNCPDHNDINDTICSNCGSTISEPINVKRASLSIEIEALGNRYSNAKDHLLTNGLKKEGDLLEYEVKTKGKAVINTQFGFLWEWLYHNNFSYESYRRQLIKGARQKANFGNDLNRSIADAILFGSEPDIIYSALSIDEKGVISYGNITLILKTFSIEKRTTALECNSFNFINKIVDNGWTWNTPIPPGFICNWSDVFKLVVSKLHDDIKKEIKFDELAKLILNSTGERSHDEFIELYIYGKIVASVIEKIKFSRKFTETFSPKESLMLKELEKKYLVELY